mmetsp:Transcript_67511/g.187171  ORF Transcript_67511/g.187171 Transcript_67511/m.187171 type:complete len:219 (-) Transcript_67511:81-737(-)
MVLLAGSWCTPLPVLFAEGDDSVHTSEDSAWQLRFDGETGTVTLTSGDSAICGKPDVSGMRIRWQNGAVWTRVEKEFGLEQPDLLSDRQVETVVDRINDAVNVWGLSESMERSLIEPPVRQVNGLLRESLRGVMMEDWQLALEALLDETKTPDSKISTVQEVLGRQLRDPLVQVLNGQINLPIIGENLEEQLFTTVVDKVLDTIVSQSVLGMEATGFV